ncbi:MAG: hypothetical protein HYS24_03450 [Ignavibacteriales bacterium]|nr:hypothetical protein [Ignavibacteriales bacterium]
MTNENENAKNVNELNNVSVVNEQKFTPHLCNIFYLDKEFGKTSVPVRSDKIKFFADDNFINSQNILNVEKVHNIEPGNMEIAVEHLSVVHSLLTMLSFEELAINSENADSIFEWNNYVTALISLLKCSKRELKKQLEYLENFPKNVA